jgi:lipopolysaccharide transport system ATP-binding protein
MLEGFKVLGFFSLLSHISNLTSQFFFLIFALCIKLIAKQMLALKVENLSKQYRLGEIGTGTLSHDLNRLWARLRGKEDPFAQIGVANDRTQKANSDYVWALRDINFEVEQGDAVGIIGRNGAGKSTLLKILSRTTLPTTGSVKMKGRIASLLEVGTGFHPEMTGRENIYQNGAILGMMRHEIKRKFDEIVDFSGCEAYIDTPVKRYSSGMYVRLAFAVAAHLESEILIVDEVLAVGDAEFQKKCLGKMNDVAKGEGRTVLFVSHNMAAVKSLCNKGILLENGRTKEIGRVEDVISIYSNYNLNQSSYLHYSKNISDITYKKISILNSSKYESYHFTIEEEIIIKFELQINKLNPQISLFVIIKDAYESPVFSAEIKITEEIVFLNIEKRFLTRGSYIIHSFIHIPQVTQLEIAYNVCPFTVEDHSSSLTIHGDYNYGNVFGRYEWKSKI